MSTVLLSSHHTAASSPSSFLAGIQYTRQPSLTTPVDATNFADQASHSLNAVSTMNPTNPRPPPSGFYTANTASTSNKPSDPADYSREASSTSFGFQTSPPVQYQQQRPSLAAPRAMPPYSLSAQLGEPVAASAGRSPSPSKRFNFPMGDPSERWNSIGQATHRPPPPPPAIRTSTARKPSIHANMGSASAAEPFLGYNELFSPNGVHNLSTSDLSKGAHSVSLSSDPMNAVFASGSITDPRGLSAPSNQEQDGFASRFGASGTLSSGQDDFGFPGSAGGGNPRMDDFGGRQSFAGMSGMPLAPGNLSPRSMMHFQQQQAQAQQAMPMHAAPQGGQGGVHTPAGQAGPPGHPEEITTVFIVGFPDDMTEREFANMFLFARGFEASTLKVPVGFGQAGPGGRSLENGGPLSAGPGGPYQAVSMPGSGLYDMPSNSGGAWEDQTALSRAGAGDTFSSLTNMGSLTGGGGMANAAAGGKIKQIIGFAKFRTRIEALEARDALNGRKIDAEKGCVLKTEMAKKNLHTKQRLVLPGSLNEVPGGFPPQPTTGPGPNRPLSPMGPPAHQQLPFFGAVGPYDPRSGPPPGVTGVPLSGPFGSFPSAKSTFEPASGQGKGGTGGSGTPADLMSPQEVFGSVADFPGQAAHPGLRSSGTEQTIRTVSQHPQAYTASTSDKWGPTGPLDYYNPDPGASAGSLSAVRPGAPSSSQNLTSQSASRPDWTAVGSPPGLYGVNASNAPGSQAPRPGFQRQGSRGTPGDLDRGVRGSAAAASKAEDLGKGELNGSISNSDSQQPLNDGVASRIGHLTLGSPSSEDGRVAPITGGRAVHRAPSPELPSPTGRNVVGDNHPPVNTLFVGNLPSNASSAALSQLEDQMRALFSNRRGFRQLSFRLKSNGPMCFVEFDDVHTAGKAMTELNGNSLNGAIKNGGIRLSFSKNPLFRMNTGGVGGSINSPPSGSLAGSGSGSSSGSANEGQMSLGLASESLNGANPTRR